MEFCPKCESMLVPQKQKDGTVVLVCRNCGYTAPAEKEKGEYKLVFKIRHTPQEEIIVVEGDLKRKIQITKDGREEEYKAALDYYQEWETEEE